jgi:membrane-associated protease RseP (regulator of RpoE activity)
MPPLFKFENPIKLDKQTKIGKIRGVDTYVHWTVLVVAALILSGVVRNPGLTLLGLSAYLAVLLIHETGHLIAAQRMGCRVVSIELYPIFGITEFETPWTRFDHCVIAWGGVIAQAVVAAPLIAWSEIFGSSRIQAFNVLIGILGYYSVVVAIFNLLPIPRLDGSIAWQIFSAWLEQRRARISTRVRK